MLLISRIKNSLIEVRYENLLERFSLLVFIIFSTLGITRLGHGLVLSQNSSFILGLFSFLSYLYLKIRKKPDQNWIKNFQRLIVSTFVITLIIALFSTQLNLDQDTVFKLYAINTVSIIAALALFKSSESEEYKKTEYGKYDHIIGIGFVIFSIVIHLTVITKIHLHVDETYAALTIKGLQKYGDLGTTVSGVAYHRYEVLYFVYSLIGKLTSNVYIDLRILGCFFFSICTYFLYRGLLNITKDRSTSLITTFFIISNWYIVIISTITRGYTFAIGTQFIIIFLVSKLLESLNSTKIAITKIIQITALLLISYFFFENLSVYHLLPLFGILFLIFIKKASPKLRSLTALAAVVFVIILALYITVVNRTIIQMIVNYARPFIRKDILGTFGSLLSYRNSFGVAIVVANVIYGLTKDAKTRIVSTWLLSIILFQGYIYGYKSFDFRYFFSAIPPLIFLVSLNSYNLLRKGGLAVIVGATILASLFCTSIVNFNNIWHKRIDWTLQAPLPWEDFLNLIPKNALVITDYPILVRTLRPDLELYKFSYHPQDYELLNRDITNIYLKQNFTPTELSRFFNFVQDEEVNRNFVIEENQEYCIYTAAPKIMSTQHINDIIQKKQTKPIYALITYDVPKNKSLYLSEYQLISSWSKIKEVGTDKIMFDDRSYAYTPTLMLYKQEQVN